MNDMHALPEYTAHMQALSEQLLRDASVAVWRKVFLGPARTSIRFAQQVLTLVYADARQHGWTAGELETLANRFDGHSVLCRGGDALLAFTHPLPALRAALLLQRVGADTGLSAGLSTGVCQVATFELDGRLYRTVLPPESSRAQAKARRAPPATIVIAAETYELLEEMLADEVQDGMVLIESDGDKVSQASITLAPHANADLSTFAGISMA